MRLFLICTLACAAAAPAMAAPQTILPGLWESQNTVSFPLNDHSTSRQCITAAKVEQFLSGPSNKNYSCTYSRSKVGGGAISAEGDCIDKNGMKSKIAVNGAYEPTRFDLKADLTFSLGGVPIPVHATTQARRISADCPAPAP